MELINKLPYSEHLVDLLKRCEEFLPKSTGRRALLVGVTTGVVVYLITKKRYNLPPGPRGWPLLGNALEFDKVPMYLKLIEWKKIHGPIILIKAGPMNMVTLNSADAIYQAFVKQQVAFAGRPQSYSVGLMSDGFRNISLVDYTPTWMLHRKIATKALRCYLSGSRVEKSVEDCLKLGFELLKNKENPINPKDTLTYIVFNIINKLCFDFTCDLDDKYYIRINELLDPATFDLGNGFLEDFIPPLRLFPSKKVKLVLSLMDEWIDLMGRNVRKHRETFDKDNLRDFLDGILSVQEEAKRDEDPELLSQITDRHIIQTTMDVFGAGIDSTRETLLMCLKYLAGHPQVQAKVHKEIDQALGPRRFPKISDRVNLSYTEAVLHETMRIASFGVMSIPHTTTCDTKLGEYDIPKGTMVLANLYAAHHDPEVWDEPEVFKPDRFLDQDGKLAPKHNGWVPFSSGRRMCLAESVAKPELHLLLTGILRAYKLSPPEGVTLKYELSDESFVNHCKEYKLVFESRP